MSAITTHVLDLKSGLPARAVAVRLEIHRADRWTPICDRVTDDDGRVRDFVAQGARVDSGLYRLTFLTGDYFRAQGNDEDVPTDWPLIPYEVPVA